MEESEHSRTVILTMRSRLYRETGQKELARKDQAAIEEMQKGLFDEAPFRVGGQKAPVAGQ